MNKRGYRIYQGWLYTYCRAGCFLGILFPVWMAHRFPEVLVLMVLMEILLVLCCGFALFIWSARLRFTEKGIHRVFPLPLLKEEFLSWEEITISGVRQPGHMQAIRFLYLSGNADEVSQLLRTGNLTRLLLGSGVKTVYIVPHESILKELERYMSVTMVRRLRKSLQRDENVYE